MYGPDTALGNLNPGLFTNAQASVPLVSRTAASNFAPKVAASSVPQAMEVDAPEALVSSAQVAAPPPVFAHSAQQPLHAPASKVLGTRWASLFVCRILTMLLVDAASIRKNMETGMQSVKDKGAQVPGSRASDVKSGSGSGNASGVKSSTASGVKSGSTSASHKVATKVSALPGKPEQFEISSQTSRADKKHYNEWVANILVEVCISVLSASNHSRCSRNMPSRLASSFTFFLCVSTTRSSASADSGVGRLQP